MKTLKDIILEKSARKEKKFTLDQINMILMKAGIGPGIITKAMTALNVARGLGIVEGEEDNG